MVLGRPMACNLRTRWRWAARIYEAILSKQEDHVRAIAYFSCAVLAALPTFHWLAVLLLSLVKVQVPYNSLLSVVLSFGSLVPPMFATLVPSAIVMALGVVMLFLVLRRIWLYVVKKERTPRSFVGFQKLLGYVGFWSVSLSVLVFILSIALKAGSGVPAGLLMVPAMFCVPWAFFLTEVTSFNWKAAANETA